MPPRRPPKRDKSRVEGLRAGLYVRVSKARDRDSETGRVTTDKSTEDQEADGRRFAARRELAVAGVYADPDISASRFARKQNRPAFERMLADVRAGKLDLVWFWELSRSQRRLDVFADLRDLCRDHGVLWAVGETVYDPGSYEDMMTLGMLSIVAEGESEIKSKNVRRGLASNAARGLPAGVAPYGYKRFYTAGPPGRRIADSLDRQDPDGLLPGAVLDGGPPSDDQLAPGSPARIIREIFTRYAAGEGTDVIAGDLNRRGIPTSYRPWQGRSSGSPRWRGTTIAKMLRNPAYTGKRVHQGEVLEGVKAAWPPLIEDDLFWSVQRKIAERAGTWTAPRKSEHLMSGVARCGCCRGPMWWWKAVKRPDAPGHYACTVTGCQRISIKAEWLDAYAEDKMILWLSDPAVYQALTQDNPAAATLTADIDRWETELEEVRSLFDEGEMSPVMAARKEKNLLERITQARTARDAATLPPALHGNVGPAAARRWIDHLDVQVKRAMIRAAADIRVMPAGKGQYPRAGASDEQIYAAVGKRVKWRWLIGPGA